MEQYEASLEDIRRRFAEDPAVVQIFSRECDERLFARWMLRYNAHGVHMRHHVERWISDAGTRCGQLGIDHLELALHVLSRAEAGRDRMMLSDARAIARWWRRRFGVPLDADALLAEPPPPSARFYTKLYEHVVSGPTPFAQLAIEYEIRRMSVTMGPDLVANCRRIFGPSLSCYSFLAEHLESDAGRTAFNQRQLQRILTQFPTVLHIVVETGRAALASYAAFVVECLELAERDLEAERVGGMPPSAA